MSTFTHEPTHFPKVLPANPFETAVAWFDKLTALRDKVENPNPNMINVASVDENGRPSNRIVLCRGMNADDGYLQFFTNYNGRKGRQLTANPNVAVVQYYDKQGLQVRYEGWAVKSPKADSDAYWQSRPLMNQISSATSQQSQPISDRSELEAAQKAICDEIGVDMEGKPVRDDAPTSIPRPDHWGGFRIYPERMELWVNGFARFHERAVWTRTVNVVHGENGADASVEIGEWSKPTWLQP